MSYGVARFWWHRLAVLTVALTVAATSTGCADGKGTAGGTPEVSVPQDARQLVGGQWVLTEVVSGGATRTVPESMHATWQFTDDQGFLASDTVNAISGRYRLVRSGFTTIDPATTLVGYVGSDPVRLCVIAAFQKMTAATVAVSASSPTQVIMRVPGFVMSFRRSGPAHTFPAAAPTQATSR